MATEYTETFEQILNDLLPHTPGIIRSVALRELRLAAREFFEKTYAWTVQVTGIDVDAGSVPVQIDDADANTEVIGILKVVFNDIELTPVAQKPTQVRGTTDQPCGYYLTSNPDEFVVFPPLETSQVGIAEALVALVPAFTATALPRQVTLKYHEALSQGYLSRVYAHPNKPYSAPATAESQLTKFKASIAFYTAQRKQGYNNSQNWAFPSTWGVQRLGGRG